MIKKEFILLLLITCGVVLFWVVTNIQHDRSSVTLSPELQTALEPINPNFDQDTLSKIQTLSSGSSP